MDNQLLNEVKILLEAPMDFYKGRMMYSKLFNKQPPGCKCRLSTIYDEIKNWYISNKNDNA